MKQLKLIICLTAYMRQIHAVITIPGRLIRRTRHLFGGGHSQKRTVALDALLLNGYIIIIKDATPEGLHRDKWRSSGRFGALFQWKQGLPPSYHIGMFSDWEAPPKGGPAFLLECLI